MGQVLVRNLDDRVIDSLKTRAALKGCSLEQELRDVLTAAAAGHDRRPAAARSRQYVVCKAGAIAVTGRATSHELPRGSSPLPA